MKSESLFSSSFSVSRRQKKLSSSLMASSMSPTSSVISSSSLAAASLVSSPTISSSSSSAPPSLSTSTWFLMIVLIVIIYSIGSIDMADIGDRDIMRHHHHHHHGDNHGSSGTGGGGGGGGGGSVSNDDMKHMRRSEISKALLLLKKHSVIGSDAKIVLKNNGRHLLVDPSERIRVVSNHLSKSRKNFNKIKEKSSKNKDKSKRNRDSRDNRDSSSSSNSNNHGNSHSHNDNSNLSNKQSIRNKMFMMPKETNNKALRSVPTIPPSVEAIQRNIMRRAASKTPEVIDSLMGSQMLKDITQLITAIVRNKQAGSLVELSDLITETLNERYGAHWHTISVASPKSFPEVDPTSNNELLIESILANTNNQMESLTHVAVDDHQKSAIFYATFDFGRVLRVFIFK